MKNDFPLALDADGTCSRFSAWGSYPIIHVGAKGTVYCAACATEALRRMRPVTNADRRALIQEAAASGDDSVVALGDVWDDADSSADDVRAVRAELARLILDARSPPYDPPTTSDVAGDSLDCEADLPGFDGCHGSVGDEEKEAECDGQRRTRTLRPPTTQRINP